MGKRKKFRRIPVKTETLLAIKEYLKATGNGTDPSHSLFQTLGKHGPYQERDLTPKAVNCLIKFVVKKALIQKRVHPRRIRIHDTRHTYTTLRLSKGDNITDVSKQLGHHSVKLTLDIYNHWLPGGKKSEVDALDDLGSQEREEKSAQNEG
ncbi:MAG: tyrosine-type recombinase/integrase [Deltaproteobacteria bacterium]